MRAPVHRRTRLVLLLRRIVRAVMLVGSAGVFGFSLWILWPAIRCPLELEIREGTIWLHALAKVAGVDIYDSRSVAFSNMNHGPLDSMLKGWLAANLPFLPPATVSRFFVLLLPFLLLGSAYWMCRRRLAPALFAAGTIHLFMAEISIFFMVGRPDNTGLCGLPLCFVSADYLLKHRSSRTNRAYVAHQILFGAFFAVTLLTCWRLLPAIGGALVVVLAKQLGERGLGRWKRLLTSSGLFLAGLAIVFAPVFFFELHGDPGLCFRRFFGFFQPASGWGTFSGPSFRLFPEELVVPRTRLLEAACAILAICLYRFRKRPALAAVWILMLAAIWSSIAYGYYKNQGGGGLHYFFPFCLFAWFFVVHVMTRTRSARWASAAAALAILYFMPWRAFVAQRQQVASLVEPARRFVEEAARLAHGQPIVSEDLQLFKREYEGEKVDMGDTSSIIARSKYFGTDFTHTFQTYENGLAANPPRFVMAGLFDEVNVRGTMSPELASLLRIRYRLVLRSPSTFLANGGGFAALYERKQ